MSSETPLFDFDFNKIRRYIYELKIQEKIDYLNHILDQWDQYHSPYQIDANDRLIFLFELERDFWKFIQKMIDEVATPKYEPGDAFSDAEWGEKFLDAGGVLKIFFDERMELFEFELDRIIAHSKELDSRKNQLIYLKWVFKEFEIQTTLEPHSYLKQQTGGFRRKLLKKIRRVEEKLKKQVDAGIDKGDKLDVGKNDLTTNSNIQKFPSPPNLHWEEVTIEFVSNDAIKIKARQIVKTYNYVELGFMDGRKKDVKNTLWEILQDGFNKDDGILNWDSIENIAIKRTAQVKAISNLRKRLREIFNIEDDPIVCKKVRDPQHPGKFKATYIAKFKIIDSSYS